MSTGREPAYQRNKFYSLVNPFPQTPPPILTPFSFSNGINYAKNCCLFLSVLALAAYFMAHLPTSHFIQAKKNL